MALISGFWAVQSLLGSEAARKWQRANEYRETFYQPRFVLESDSNGKNNKRKLEAGEVDENSERYHICAFADTIEDMRPFGVGVYSYFKLTSIFGLLMLGCGLFSLPAALYFSSDSYDSKNDFDRSWAIEGSASCMSQRRVCLNADCTTYAGETHFPSLNVPRYSTSYSTKDITETPYRDNDFQFNDDVASPSLRDLGFSIGRADVLIARDGAKLTVGLRACDIRLWIGVVDFCMMLSLALALLLLWRFQEAEFTALDNSEDTTQDFSIIVSDPPGDCTDPDIWKDWFEERYGKGTVFMVTVTVDNGALVRLLRKKRTVERDLKLAFAANEAERAKEEAKSHFEDGSAFAIMAQIRESFNSATMFTNFKIFIGLESSIDSFKLQLLEIHSEIAEYIKTAQFKASCVFVTFNEQKTQQRVLADMCVGKLNAIFDFKHSVSTGVLFRDEVLNVDEAPEPAEIQYAHLDSRFFEILRRQLVSWVVISMSLVVAFYSVDGAFSSGQTAIGAILIALWNAFLPELCKYLTTVYEVHHTVDGLENSFIFKTVLARAFCSAIIIYLVGFDHSSDIIGPYYIGSIQAIMVADAFTSPLIRFCQITGTFKRYILSPLVSHEKQMLYLQRGGDYYLAERYTDVIKSMLMALYFSSIFPLGYFYASTSCFVSFWVDKYCFLRVFREKPPTGAKLVRTSRSLAGLMILIHSVVTAHYYYSWPFDNLCETDTPLSAAGVINSLGLKALPAVYRQCSSVSSAFLPPTRKEPWMQKNGDQFTLVAFYNVVAIISIVYIFSSYFAGKAFGSLSTLFYFKHKINLNASGQIFEKMHSAQGYIPDFEIFGEEETVLMVYAPHAFEASKAKWERNGCGGFEFSPYLLRWTASKQCYVYDPPDPKPDDDEKFPLTMDQEDAVYRLSNTWNDSVFELMPKKWSIEKKANTKRRMFSRAKQYIWNERPVVDDEIPEVGKQLSAIENLVANQIQKQNTPLETAGSEDSNNTEMWQCWSEL